MTVHEAIATAERLLPGTAAPDGERDPRWQAIIAVGEHIETHPEEVWMFARRWGASPDKDLRMAVATCLLEHLLEHHFDLLIDRFESATREGRLFADAVSRCWPFGQSADGRRAKRFARLVSRKPEA